MKCDLHMHSNCSDGIFTPEQLVEMAKEKGLDCIALTDHDTVSGISRARKKAQELGLKFVTGMELSTMTGGKEVHILVFNPDVNAEGFDEAMQQIVELRLERNRLMQQKFDEMGIRLNIASIKSSGTIGRGDIAREMVRLGICQNVPEAFDKYIGAGKPCYVQSRRLTPTEAIRFALHFGGIPVLAHPKNLHMSRMNFERFLRPLVSDGLLGIEAEYFTHNNFERKFYGRMAKKYKLIITGGSDFHDYTHGVLLGKKSFSPTQYVRTVLKI